MTDQLNNFEDDNLFIPRAIPRIAPVWGSSMYYTGYECPTCGCDVEFNGSNDIGVCRNCHSKIRKPLSS